MTRSPLGRLPVASALVVVFVLVGAPACGKGLEEVSRVFEGKVGSAVQDSKPAYSAFDDAARSKLKDAVKEIPGGDLTADAAATKNTLLATDAYYDRVVAAGQTVADRWRAVPDQLRSSATRRVLAAPTANARSAAADFMTGHGEDIAKDVACDLAWKVMYPDDRTAIGKDLVAEGYHRSVADLIVGAENMLPASIVDAITNNLYRTIAHATPMLGVTFDVVSYAKDLYAKAGDLVAGASTPIVRPDGTRMTQALPYYVRLCMTPGAR